MSAEISDSRLNQDGQLESTAIIEVSIANSYFPHYLGHLKVYVSLLFASMNGCYVFLQVNASSWCPGNQPDSFSVEVKCAQGCVTYEKRKIYHDLPDLQNDRIYIEISENVDCIPTNDKCTVAISSVNEAGSSNSTTTIFSRLIQLERLYANHSVFIFSPLRHI